MSITQRPSNQLDCCILDVYIIYIAVMIHVKKIFIFFGLILVDSIISYNYADEEADAQFFSVLNNVCCKYKIPGCCPSLRRTNEIAVNQGI